MPDLTPFRPPRGGRNTQNWLPWPPEPAQGSRERGI